MTSPATRGVVDAENPWPGLEAFREADQEFFRGRPTETEALARVVLRERLTVFYGTSGLGKSSLLLAGLFPLLRQDDVLPVYIRLDFADPAPDLVAQVRGEIARQAADADLEAPKTRAGETLWESFHRAGAAFRRAGDGPHHERSRTWIPLLVFDQFEELFTLGRGNSARAAASAALVEELADLAEGYLPAAVRSRIDENPDEADDFAFDRHDYKLLFCLREDYLADLDELRGQISSLGLHRLRLRPMSGEAALAVVDQNPRLITIEVAEKVVRSVAASGDGTPLTDLEVEPALLSVVCRELNNKRRENERITEELLAGSQEEILADFYEESFRGLGPRVRTFVEDELLTRSGYRDSERLEDALGASEVSAEAIEQLVRQRLLRIEERAGQRRVELTHDLLTNVIARSRDRRREREARQQEKEALRRLRTSRAFLTLFVVLTLFASAAAWLAFRAQLKAQKALAQADVKDARQELEGLNRRRALAYLARALQLAPDSLAARISAVVLLADMKLIPLNPLPHDGSVWSASFSFDGLRVVSASEDWTARVWDASTGETVGQPMQHDDSVYSALFSIDGSRVVTASEDRTARVWDASTGKAVGQPMQNNGRVLSASFSIDGKRVVTASEDWTARVWDASTGVEVGQSMRHEDWVVSALFSVDGTRVVTASADRTARVWDASTDELVGQSMQHDAEVRSALFSVDGRRVVTASKDRTARMWDSSTGEAVGQPMRHDAEVRFASFSVDGTRVVTASSDKTARVWDASTGEAVGQPMRHDDAVLSALFSVDGTRVVTASEDHTARVWDASTGEAAGQPMRHDAWVHSASFSVDGTRVVTASLDGTARAWDASTGEAVGQPMRHDAQVLSALFSVDGTRVVTASADHGAGVGHRRPGRPEDVRGSIGGAGRGRGRLQSH